MSKEEHRLLVEKIAGLEKDFKECKERFRDYNGVTVSQLRTDLGKAVKRIEELKQEAERYKEEATRQIEEKKALYERRMKNL